MHGDELSRMEEGQANSACCCGYCGSCCISLTQKWESLTANWCPPSNASIQGFLSAGTLTLVSNSISFAIIALAPAQWSIYLALYNTATFFNLAQTAKTRAVSQSFKEYISQLDDDITKLAEMIELKSIATDITREPHITELLTELKKDAQVIIAALKTARSLNSRKELMDLLFTLGYLIRLILDLAPHTAHVSQSVDIAMTVLGGLLYAWGTKRSAETDLYRLKAHATDDTIQWALLTDPAIQADRQHQNEAAASSTATVSANAPSINAESTAVDPQRARASTLNEDARSALILRLRREQQQVNEEEERNGTHSRVLLNTDGQPSSRRNRMTSASAATSLPRYNDQIRPPQPDELRAPATLELTTTGMELGSI